MFFTQEDYLKIQQWLQRNSVKDTEFQEAADLIGNEVVTLVQNGSNKKVYLKDLVNQIFSIGVTDFINVSALCEKYNITLSDATKLVPYKSRKRGQVITFLNTDGNWEIYQFTGVKNQWNNIELWKDLFDWQTILDISFEADEEDITSNISNEEEKIKLSFKNREYDPLIHSGLGYKILRKNIVQSTDPTYGELTKNILYQNMVSNTYTIYEIRYDFDLEGNTINIPEGCVLKYNGGSLSNGTLIYEDTIIEGVERLSNVNIEGNYRYPYTGDESNPDTQLAPTMTQFRKLNTQVDNIADDEDLTKIYDDEKGQEVLQLKNRQYIQGSNNGMGYIILRRSKSFKEQLTQSNTIYEIRYDFDLESEEVEIPENCVLKFEGGSLRNGSVLSSNTHIAGGYNQIFYNINLVGAFVGEGRVEWFGADVTKADNRSQIQQCVNSFRVTTIRGMYSIASSISGICLEIPNGHELKGERVTTVSSSDNDGIQVNTDVKTAIKVNTGCKIKNIHVKSTIAVSGETSIGIISEGTRAILLDCVIVSGFGTGIYLNTFTTSLIRTESWYCNIGFYFTGTELVKYTSVSLLNCYAVSNKHAGFYFMKMIYCAVYNCACDATGYKNNDLIENNEGLLAAYVTKDCTDIVFDNCGAERNARLLSISNSGRVCFSGKVLVDDSDINTDELKQYITIANSSGITIENTDISFSSSYSGKFLKIRDYRENFELFYTNSISCDKIWYEDASGGVADIRTLVRTNNLKKIIDENLSNYKDIYNNELSAYTTYLLTDTTYFSNKPIIDYTKSATLIFKSADDNPKNLVFDMKSRKILKGYKKIIFENCIISVSSYWGDGDECLFECIDTDIVFNNCVFVISGKKTLSFFNLTNARVEWNNTYEYNTNTSRYIDNVSSISFNYSLINPTYSTYNYIKLPTGSRVITTDYKTGIYIGANKILSYSNELKIIDATGADV